MVPKAQAFYKAAAYTKELAVGEDSAAGIVPGFHLDDDVV